MPLKHTMIYNVTNERIKRCRKAEIYAQALPQRSAPDPAPTSTIGNGNYKKVDLMIFNGYIRTSRRPDSNARE